MPGSDSAMRRCTSPPITAYVSSASSASPLRELDAAGAGRRRGVRRRCALRARSPSARGWASSAASDPGVAAPLRATRSARCRSCADTRSSAARAASPACRAASPGPAGRPRRGRRSRARRRQVAGRDVERERRVAAVVVADRHAAVDPHGGCVVDRAEVQEEPFARRQAAAPRSSAGTSTRGRTRSRPGRWPAPRGRRGRERTCPTARGTASATFRTGRTQIRGAVEGHPSVAAQLWTRITAAEMIRR